MHFYRALVVIASAVCLVGCGKSRKARRVILDRPGPRVKGRGRTMMPVAVNSVHSAAIKGRPCFSGKQPSAEPPRSAARPGGPLPYRPYQLSAWLCDAVLPHPAPPAC